MKFRRILAAVLSVLMLSSVMVFTASADTTTPVYVMKAVDGYGFAGEAVTGTKTYDAENDIIHYHFVPKNSSDWMQVLLPECNHWESRSPMILPLSLTMQMPWSISAQVMWLPMQKSQRQKGLPLLSEQPLSQKKIKLNFLAQLMIESTVKMEVMLVL